MSIKIVDNYIKDLRNREIKYETKYLASKSKYKKLYTANQTTSGLALVTAGGTVASALSVIGVPVAIGVGAASGVFAIVSGVLTGVGKGYYQSSVKYMEKLASCRKARIDLEKLMGLQSNGEARILNAPEIETAYKIYSDVMEELSSVGLEPMNALSMSVPDLSTRSE